MPDRDDPYADDEDDQDEPKVRLRPVTAAELATVASDRFCYISPTGKKETRRQPLPAWFVKDFLLDGVHRLPQLNGVLRHPAVRLDGSVEYAEGYDSVTKCWVDGEGIVGPGGITAVAPGHG